MDDAPDRRDDEVTRTDVPPSRRESTGPPTDRVRIVGAEPAGEATSVIPVVSRQEHVEDVERDPEARPAPANALFGDEDDGFGQPSVRLTGEPGDAGATVDPVSPGQTVAPSGTPAPTELPHWTEPPTGQVPAVLARDPGDEDGASTIGAPSWREEDADWVAHDEEFEPAMFGEDAVALGSLDESNSTDVERRPWEFDLETTSQPTSGSVPRTGGEAGEGGHGSTIEPITEPVEIVAPLAGEADEFFEVGVAPREELFASRPPIGRDSSGAEEWSGGEAAGAERRVDRAESVEPSTGAPTERPADEELYPTEKPLPTGSARVGRARRSGLLPARMRAKRPEDADVPTDAPLAAEPPGASVTDVPGAGRKRRGVAGLAAADRTADRDAALIEEDIIIVEPDVGDGVDIVATAAVAAGVPPRRPKRRTLADRGAPRSAGPDGEAPTGGGPPSPRRGHSITEPRRSTRGVHEGGSSIGLRVGTGLAVAVVALAAFKLGTVTSLVLCLIVVTFAAGECFSVLRRAGYHPATLLGLVGTLSLMIGAYTKGVAAVPLVLVMITAFTLIWYLCGIESGSPVAGTAATMLTVGWVSLLGSYAALLLAPSLFPDRHGIAFLLGAIIATVANDVGALVAGGWMGRHPLAPSISPNKTWEGLVGGTVLTVVVSTVVVGDIHPWTPATAALLGLVVAVVAPIGDLCESLLKRDLRLKDMGTLLPGHGGVLDRVDALLFVLPATYYLVRALNIG